MLLGPVFNVELLTIARRARYYAIRFVYGMILLFFVVQAAARWRGRVAALWEGGELSIAEMADTGRSIFITFIILQSVSVLVLTPALVSGVVADEKRRKTLDYLLASRLTSAEIILGKLFARLLYVGIFLAIGLPVMSLISLFGGVEPQLVVLVYAATLSTACFLGALSILISTLARRPREASSQVYILELAWLLCPTLVHWLMPMAGGKWTEFYYWIKPANDLMRWSSPFSLVDPTLWRSPSIASSAFLWMVGLQGACAVGFVLLAIGLLRPVFRREADSSRRLGWLLDARRGRRFLPRPEVGDDAMLWKERYVSRTSGIIKIAGGLVVLVVVGILGYATYQFAQPAFVELWNHGYSTGESYHNRQEFNAYLRAITTLIYVTWCLGIASLAAAGVVAEREEDTWTSLTATPLSGEEILRAKMFGAVWGTRWIGFLLIAFWALGLVSGAVHPLGIVAVVLETAVFVWFVTALGVFFSLSSKTSVRAQSATMAVLVICNGVYMLCCIPMEPGTIFFGLAITPLIEAISLLSYRELSSLLNNRDSSNEVEAVVTCVAGVALYGAAALILTMKSFISFDAKIDRPRRGWDQLRVPAKTGALVEDENDDDP